MAEFGGLLVFGFSAAFVLYVLFGYPLLAAVIARWNERPVRKRYSDRAVSVLLAIRNGEPWIRRKLENLLALDYPHQLLEIICISDGSSDRSAEIAREYAARGNVRVLETKGIGKAGALNLGMAQASGEVFFFTDARQPLDPQCLRELVACLEDPDVGVASGELVILDGNNLEEANIGLYWRYEKWIRRRHSAIDSVLGATGAVYAMRRALAVRLPEDTLLDDVYLPLAAFFRGYRLIFDSAARAYDYPTALKTEFRRKLRTQAGVYQILRAYPQLLGPANRMWFHFLSHKVGRLLLPFALLTAIVSSFWLPDPLRRLLWSGFALFFGLAAADIFIPEMSWLKRIASPARTFLVLLSAALCAVSIFILPSRRFWKPYASGEASG